MKISLVRFDAQALQDYVALFQACFPQSGKFSQAYLEWLYCRNPAGEAIGFDARDGARLAAHYVCIPVHAVLQNRPVRAMLSLNTATHPEYQGRGLFTQLAERTYAHAAGLGVAAVCGVANGNSTPGFTRKLGFTLIEPLQAAVGVGMLAVSPNEAARTANFRCAWDQAVLAWRAANPANPVALRLHRGRLQCSAVGVNRLVRAYAELPSTGHTLPAQGGSACWATPRLFLGLMPGSARLGAYRVVPQRWRPSPLNLIFRALSDAVAVPQHGETSLSFLDFDAY